MRIDSDLRPYDWYKYHVVTGAKENNLPADYVSMLEGVESILDPDKERERKELNIYREAARRQT
jgi:hypothetical protein